MTVEISDISALIRDGHLTDVRFLRFNAEVRTEPRADIEEDDVVQTLKLALRTLKSVIEFRVSIDIETRECVYSAMAATQVNLDEASIDPELLPEFAPRIGFNVIYPYLREVIHSSSARLRRENIVIPLVDPNTIRLVGDDLDPQEDLAGSTT